MLPLVYSLAVDVILLVVVDVVFLVVLLVVLVRCTKEVSLSRMVPLKANLDPTKLTVFVIVGGAPPWTMLPVGVFL